MCECHETYGAHLRSKNIAIYACRDTTGGRDLTLEKRNQRELDLYASARKQGIEPEGTVLPKVRAALDWSDKNGRPYKAGDQYGSSDDV